MSLFGWSLPPGCTLNDIDELCGEHGPSCFCEDCLGEPPEESENEMNFEPIWTPTTYERIPYAPHNSTMHDERCDCPWCMPGEPDELTDDESAQLADEMDTCNQCGAEISPAEGYFNNNVCNACAFGLPDDVCTFGGAQAEHQIGAIDELAHEARLADEAEETAEWEEEWEQRNDVRDAWNALQSVPSYVEREADEKAAREYHENGYSIYRVD